MNPERRVERAAFLEKIGVTLEELRVAARAAERAVPRIRRLTGIEMFEAPRLMKYKGKVNVGDIRLAPASSHSGKLRSAQAQAYRKMYPPKDVDRLIKMMKLPRGSFMQGPTSKQMAQVVPELAPFANKLTPQGKEIVNRSVFLHEAAELGKHPGESRFSSHMSVRPPLQDLNIASTLEGPGGSEAAEMIRNYRDDVGDLSRYFGLERMNLGRERVSRHAIRRIQEMVDQARHAPRG